MEQSGEQDNQRSGDVEVVSFGSESTTNTETVSSPPEQGSDEAPVLANTSITDGHDGAAAIDFGGPAGHAIAGSQPTSAEVAIKPQHLVAAAHTLGQAAQSGSEAETSDITTPLAQGQNLPLAQDGSNQSQATLSQPRVIQIQGPRLIRPQMQTQAPATSVSQVAGPMPIQPQNNGGQMDTNTPGGNRTMEIRFNVNGAAVNGLEMAGASQGNGGVVIPVGGRVVHGSGPMLLHPHVNIVPHGGPTIHVGINGSGRAPQQMALPPLLPQPVPASRLGQSVQPNQPGITTAEKLKEKLPEFVCSICLGKCCALHERPRQSHVFHTVSQCAPFVTR
jgi:hypothetical protein